jgi:hypothetical protein
LGKLSTAQSIAHPPAILWANLNKGEGCRNTTTHFLKATSCILKSRKVFYSNAKDSTRSCCGLRKVFTAQFIANYPAFM